MGIIGLYKVLADIAPNAIKNREMKHYLGRKIAIDANVCLYQFLMAVPTESDFLKTTAGETTAHLMCLFFRSICLLENGIKPVYVFDGQLPEAKSYDLSKRAERRELLQNFPELATKSGRQLVQLKRQHIEDAKHLLSLMGIPYINAPSEAKAQCAALVKSGKVFATASEEMDALAFGSSVLLRHVTLSQARKITIQEIHLDEVLQGLQLSQEKFIDLCILLGCDYCAKVEGVGPKHAIELMKKYRNLTEIYERLELENLTPPRNWSYEAARKLFVEPEIVDPETLNLQWTEPKTNDIIKFLCGERKFNIGRITSGVNRIKKSRGSTQTRLDTFLQLKQKGNRMKTLTKQKTNKPRKNK